MWLVPEAHRDELEALAKEPTVAHSAVKKIQISPLIEIQAVTNCVRENTPTRQKRPLEPKHYGGGDLHSDHPTHVHDDATETIVRRSNLDFDQEACLEWRWLASLTEALGTNRYLAPWRENIDGLLVVFPKSPKP